MRQKKESCMRWTFFWRPPGKNPLWAQEKMVHSHRPEKGMLYALEFFPASTAEWSGAYGVFFPSRGLKNPAEDCERTGFLYSV